ncbi:hypothetical protein AMAG_12690 [Allomyces macrogynus ATCC 38327]|uniref:Myosin motor domain-containing protein n=1 Tax=Allomyces macrogynus (strain ATCC 38327) TaxID=578462 RepID=A0A0L0T1S1_ALLM3|nr:hypothetical protein AMAG_12690 [Allomyces macrogynus ATCC 38327]|eukprot:KNE68519.1 hypothetical protein AMAG_12690 [Allomyces macrogynus ATCC 38327]
MSTKPLPAPPSSTAVVPATNGASSAASGTSSVDALLALYSPGTSVWVPDDMDGWRAATVHAVIRQSDLVTVKVVDDRGHDRSVTTALTKSTDDLPPLRNPPMLEGIEDLTNLSYLHEPAVLHNIRVRYAQHQIYTYSGIVLIAMNPFQKVALYTNDVVRAYSGKRRGELEPHLFAVAEDAFRGMVRDKKNQSIIVSGESGAGKTVSAKYIMRYFATADSGDGTHADGADDFDATADLDDFNGATMSEVEQQVLATNPIMESFGNAKTTRNDNSSRFGKYIELLFNDHAKIIGARIRTYLLERSRVVFQPETERNYHIFYQLCAGAPAAERKSLGLHPYSFFSYLNQGGNGVVKGIDDAAEFEATQRALSTVGVSVSEQWQIFRLLAAILHLGNVQIIALRSDEAYIPDDDPALVMACKLLGVPATEFKKWLVKRQIVTRFEKIVSGMTATLATVVRDSVAKFMYAGLFEWLVDKTNASLCPDEVVASFTSFIGVLDIYGFEHFKKNSFEQLCINYANERLQAEFNQHVFTLEQEEYVREEISWSFIDFYDNKPCLELIEGKLGILALLDEESRLPGGSDKALISKLYSHFEKKHPNFGKPRFSNTSFIVHHFADHVEYEIDGFLDKNKDTVPDELLALLNASTFELLPDVLAAHKVNKPASTPSGGGPARIDSMTGVRPKSLVHRQPTLGSVFKQSLTQLMDTIASTEVSYIRCIKSNSAKLPFQFEPQLVLAQLRACGVLETIRISTAGYPGRWTFSEFADRYYMLVPSTEWHGFKDIRALCTTLLNRTIPDEDKYQVGRTKIFFRAGQLAFLEKRRSARLHACATSIQRVVRGHLARKHFLAVRNAAVTIQRVVRGFLARTQAKHLRERRAATRIQALVRGHLARRRYLRLRRAAIVVQSVWRGNVARREAAQWRQVRAATRIQAAWRASVTRRVFAAHMRKIVLAQSCIRRYLAKKQLKQLKVEARSIAHIKEISYRFENKVIELTQSLAAKEKQARTLGEAARAADAQVKVWRDKWADAQAQMAKMQDRINELVVAAREVEALTTQTKGLTSQINAANEFLKAKDAELGAANDTIQKLKDELAKKVAQEKERERERELAPPPGLEWAQIHSLRQEVDALKQQLAEEREWRQDVAEMPAAAAQRDLDDEYFRRGAAPSNMAVAGPWRAVPAGGQAISHQRRFSSVDGWTPQMKAMITIDFDASRKGQDGAAATPDATAAAAHEQLEFLLQDPALERELVDGIVRNAPIPHAASHDATRRQVVYPAHVVGVYVIQAWHHGLATAVSALTASGSAHFDDEVVGFWLANVLELDAILRSAQGTISSSTRRGGAGGPDRGILAQARRDVERVFAAIYFPWVRALRKRIVKYVVPSVIEYQALPGFISKTAAVGAASLFRANVVGGSGARWTVDQLLDVVEKVWSTLQYYYVDAAVVDQTIAQLMAVVGVQGFNHLIMRKHFATWKRGMQVQYNVARVREWCTQHGQAAAAKHLDRLAQAAKVLQLTKASPTNVDVYVDDLLDVCDQLTPTQVAKLMAIYTVSEFETPLAPDVVRAVADRAVRSKRAGEGGETLLLAVPPDNDTSWYVRPEPRRVMALEAWMPPSDGAREDGEGEDEDDEEVVDADEVPRVARLLQCVQTMAATASGNGGV